MGGVSPAEEPIGLIVVVSAGADGSHTAGGACRVSPATGPSIEREGGRKAVEVAPQGADSPTAWGEVISP